MERTSKVLTINCTQSVICKICTKQNQQMNKTMKEDGGNGNYLDLNFIVARHCLFQFFGWELFLKRDLKASSNAITTYFIFFPYFLQMLSSFFFFFLFLFSEVCRRLSYLSAYYTHKIKETERERYLA